MVALLSASRFLIFLVSIMAGRHFGFFDPDAAGPGMVPVLRDSVS
jgi:hypothetical protein